MREAEQLAKMKADYVEAAKTEAQREFERKDAAERQRRQLEAEIEHARRRDALLNPSDKADFG